MQIRAEKCNPSLKPGRAPIEFGAENLHKHQKVKKKKKKNFPMLTERLLTPSKIHCVKEPWHSGTVSMEE